MLQFLLETFERFYVFKQQQTFLHSQYFSYEIHRHEMPHASATWGS